MRFYLLLSFITHLWLIGVQDLNAAHKTLELELHIEADPAILFNHFNPVYFTLSSPYGSHQQEASGEFFADDPEIYYQSLNPVLWRLELPKNSADNLKVEIKAKLALCDKQKGFCYFQDIVLEEMIDISQVTSKQSLTMTLTRPEY
jgi:hypothetical protein